MCWKSGHGRHGSRKAVRRAKNHDVAAALTGFRIAFVAQKRIGVLNGNDTDMQFRSQQALGGQLAAEGKNAVENVIPHLFVDLQIDRAFFFANGDVHLV